MLLILCHGVISRDGTIRGAVRRVFWLCCGPHGVLQHVWAPHVVCLGFRVHAVTRFSQS